MKAAAASDNVALLLKCNSNFGGIQKTKYTEGPTVNRTEIYIYIYMYADVYKYQTIISATLLTAGLQKSC